MSDTAHAGTFAMKAVAALQDQFSRLRAQPRTPIQRLNLALWLIFLCCYPIAVIGVAFDVRPGFSMAWAGSVLLFMQGALAVLWLVLRLGWQRGGALALAIATGGYLGETLGVATGFPFGPYDYAAILFPRLPGTVPLPVIGAWLVVVITAVALARWLIPAGVTHDHVRRWRQVALATLLGVGLDLVLEPVAVRLQHYWLWHATGPYYGIPTTNFIGWAALCALLAGGVIAAWPREAPPANLTDGEREEIGLVPPLLSEMERELEREAPPFPMIALFVLTTTMFGVVDLTHGLLIAAGISSVLVAVLALRWRATYHIAEGTRAKS